MWRDVTAVTPARASGVFHVDGPALDEAQYRAIWNGTIARPIDVVKGHGCDGAGEPFVQGLARCNGRGSRARDVVGRQARAQIDVRQFFFRRMPVANAEGL